MSRTNRPRKYLPIYPNDEWRTVIVENRRLESKKESFLEQSTPYILIYSRPEVTISALIRNAITLSEGYLCFPMTSFQEIINSDTPTLVDFHATWCGPCKAMSPVIDKVKTILGANIRILKVDVDKNQGVAAKYKIRTVPTLILFKNGEILWRKSGEMSPKELENYIRLAS